MSGGALLSGDSGSFEVLTSDLFSRAPVGCCPECQGPGVRRGNPGRASAHLDVPHPFRRGTNRGNHVGLSPVTLPVKRSPPPGQGRDAGGWAVPRGNLASPCARGCQLGFPRGKGESLFFLVFSRSPWQVAGSSAGRRRALPRGTRGHSRGARALVFRRREAKNLPR